MATAHPNPDLTVNRFQRAQKVLVGGVNSPIRSFRGVGGEPIFMKRGEGSYLITADNLRLIDFVGSYGPLILGHAHPEVIQAVQNAVTRGLTFGAPTEVETCLAERVCQAVASIKCLRFVSSGTEAVMTALRLARAATGRELFVKFSGCYHGHADPFLSAAGSGLMTLGIAASPGVPEACAAAAITLPFNDSTAVAAIMQQLGRSIAAILVEPVACNMGLVPPKPDFLEQLRTLCDRYGALLIFDEVITGFRISLHGAQGQLGITPDLTTFGKIIGGGMPVGAIGGPAGLMRELAPCGSVFQAGTLSGNPIAMSAGLATVEQLMKPGFYDELDNRTLAFYQQLDQRIHEEKLHVQCIHRGSIFYFYFAGNKQMQEPSNVEDIQNSDRMRYKRFFHAALKQGVYLAPSPFEVAFCSDAHSPEILNDAAERLIIALKQSL